MLSRHFHYRMQIKGDIFYRVRNKTSVLTTCTRVLAVEINLRLSRYPKPLPGEPRDKRKRDDACGARNRRRLARRNRRGQRTVEKRVESNRGKGTMALARCSLSRA